MELSFRPIDLECNEDACIAFRRDSYICSFGTEAGMREDYGPNGARYLATLRERLAEFSEGYVHVWQDLGPRPGREKVNLMELPLGAV